MPDPYDHVDFFEYDGDSDSVEKIATASLIDGKVIFDGPGADSVERVVRESDSLKPYLKRDGYQLLAQLPVEFSHGTYFNCSEVKEATIL